MVKQSNLVVYDDIHTPALAVHPLVELLEKKFKVDTDWKILEPCERSDGETSEITKVFRSHNYYVMETGIHKSNISIFDVLKYVTGIDMVITNPPYSKPIGDKIIKFLFESEVPFAVLLYGTRVFGVGRHEMYKKYKPAFALFNNRIDFTGSGSPPNDNFWLIGNLGNENKIFYLKQEI